MDIVGVCCSSTGGCACRWQALNQGCRPHMNINTQKLEIHPQLCCSSQVQMHAGGKGARDAGPVTDLTAKVWQSQTPHTTHHEQDVCWSSHVHTHAGGKVTRDAGPVKGGTSTIAFVEDPTGYKWEIIGSKTGDAIREPIAQAGPLFLPLLFGYFSVPPVMLPLYFLSLHLLFFGCMIFVGVTCGLQLAPVNCFPAFAVHVQPCGSSWAASRQRG